MWKLQRYGSARFECSFNPINKIVDVWHMREHIVCNDQIGLFVLPGKLERQSLAEEFSHNGNAQFRGGISCTGCRFDAETRNTSRDKMLQKISVVRGHLNHE